MKKLFLSLFVMMTMSMNMNASTVNTRVQKVETYLGLHQDQIDKVQKSMEDYYQLVDQQKELSGTGVNMRKETNIHLKQMHRVLNQEQYHKYLHLLNETLKNNGVDLND